MKEREYWNLVFGKDLDEIDPDVARLIEFEEERQARKIILIPSESYCPKPVREAMGSVFVSVYAEGYPRLQMTRDEIELLLDFDHELSYYRRYGDRRFYKGVDYVDLIECLAQRRIAECFANERVGADDIYVNVQPLSGTPANLSVYEALMEPGDTLMGMALPQGGHLTHGSPFNISGRRYNVVSYAVSRATERLDYDEIMELALKYRPKIIVAGYTSYSWAPDWEKFREIADACGALLMADIAHTAGMAIAGAYPNPVGIADITTFTTHKTIFGPRGAVILTTDPAMAELIDNAVFPGEQGGPHINKFAAIAVAFKIAQTEEYKRLQHKIVENAVALAEGLQKRGLKLSYGGTNTHLLVIDLNPLKSAEGFPLKGEIAARILDLAGIVTNKNTIPGDADASEASGIRIGTPWVTQRGMGKAEMDKIAELIHRIIVNIKPFTYIGLTGPLWRGKIELDILEDVKRDAAELVADAEVEIPPRGLGYPHYWFLLEKPPARETVLLAEHRKLDAELAENAGWTVPLHYHDPKEELETARNGAALFDLGDMGLLAISGERATPFLQQTCTNNVSRLRPGEVTRSFLLDRDGQLLDDVSLLRLESDRWGRDRYILMANPENAERVKAWLRGLADGYVLFDEEDIFRKVEGPVVVEDLMEDADGDARRVALALHGPKSSEVLRRLNADLEPTRLKPGAGWEGKLGGVEAVVLRNGYRDGDARFELLVHPDETAELWNTLLEAGAEPAGLEARNALRSEAGLPLYREGEPRPDGLALYKAGWASLFRVSKPYFVGQRNLESVRPRVEKKEWRWEEREGALRRTALYEEHLKLGARMVPFAGWEMPVQYTSIIEEHRAVREAAGLFDVAHMGVIEVAGEYATDFLDMVTSNYVRWIKDGQSQYSYLLDPEGNVIDDLFLYRRAADRYMLVVNAANAEKDFAWLQAVNSGEYLIDREHPDLEVEGPAIIRDLKAPSSGDDRRVDIALQGPASLAILQSLADDPRLKERLSRLQRTEFIETELAGMSLILARTGYTGEEVGYELYVHPDDAPRLWNLLLEKGEPFGIKPTGLGARDSTRTEAGLPLHGHDLAGPYNISPIEAGFGSYVKFHKPFFIGRKALLEKEATRRMELLRFRMNERGVRMARLGDPVVDKRGKYIGRVTSCALGTDGFQVGLAYVERKYNREGAQIGIIPLPARIPPAKPVEELALGDKLLLHQWATVLTRFPIEEGKVREGPPQE
ncbi:MAG: glycine cleavage system aminomethyltransferase GcvT [Anaerolineae bacterium]